MVSTGGTSKYLQEHGIAVVEVSQQTGYPEVMDGRVRTLHPRIHMSLLARSFDLEDMALLKKEGLEPFDLVIGNLYPFEKTVVEHKRQMELEAKLNESGKSDAPSPELAFRELIEEIDIGGPALLRASAKSFERITVLCDPADYEFAKKGATTFVERKKLAAKVFSHISVYDSLIAEVLGMLETTEAKNTRQTFDANPPDLPNHATISFGGKLVSQLRYGENPHQSAFWFQRPARKGLHDARVLQGKELSFNNILDLEAAIRSVRSFHQPCAVAVKHNNPCGVGLHPDALKALQLTLKADPVSVFGGIVACNRRVTVEMAELLNTVFLECVVAPEFEPAALTVFAKKKNLRILQWDFLNMDAETWEFRSVEGGLLVQSKDQPEEWESNWKILGKNPSTEVQSDLLFAWNVCQHLKSNAIAVVGEGQTLGLGMGQVNRVDAVRHALERFHVHHGERRLNGKLRDVVLASDAFFPFADSIEIAAKAGVNWIIQPGGSIKDDEVFSKARELNVNMVITGSRHFKH